MRNITYVLIVSVIVVALLAVSFTPYYIGGASFEEKKPLVEWGSIKIQLSDIVLHVCYVKPPAHPKALVVIIPGFREIANTWNTTGLPQLLAIRGYAVVAFDLRGHGGSILRPNGTTVNIGSLTDTDYRRMIIDVKAVVETFRKYFGVKRVFLVGSDIGASLAVMYAAENGAIKGIVLVSPSFETKIPFPIELFEKYLIERDGRVAIIYSQGDAQAIKVIDAIDKLNLTNETTKRITYYASGRLGHGVSLVFNDRTIPSRIASIVDVFYAASTKETSRS